MKRIAWNKGLTKDTDERVKKYGINGSKSKKGIHYSFKTEFKKGHISPKFMLGKKHTKETKQKMRETHKRLKTKPPTSFKENHWNWKGGITPLARQIRDCFKYRQWRSDVFTRDDFTCVSCGIKSGNGKVVYLEADHYPKRFSKILEEYHIKTLEQAFGCEELWNINNGRTLCLKCHNETKGKERKNVSKS